MASGMDSTRATSLVSAAIGKTAFPTYGVTNTSKLKLMSTAASETTDGTEITGGSYPAGGIGMTISSTFGSSSYASGIASITNSGASVSQTNMPTVGTPGIVSASVWDGTSGTALRWWWGGMQANVVTNLGDTLTFNTSSITMQLNV